MSTFLADLLVREVSATPDPANETPGWLVTKSRSRQSRPIVDEVLKSADGSLTVVVERFDAPHGFYAYVPGHPCTGPDNSDGLAALASHTVETARKSLGLGPAPRRNLFGL